MSRQARRTGSRDRLRGLRQLLPQRGVTQLVLTGSLLAALLASLPALAQTGAAAVPATAPAASPAADTLTATADSGRALFESRCALCHRGSGPGVFMLERRVGKEQAILEERSNLTAEYLRAVVRNGIGSMPRFSRGELTDAELEQLSRYLVE